MNGTVKIQLKDTKKLEHLGIKCYLVGYLCNFLFNQKSIQTKISVLNLLHYPNSLNLQAFLVTIKSISLNL
jgi:hypothetical protein